MQAVRWGLLVLGEGKQGKADGRSKCTYEYGHVHNTSAIFNGDLAKDCQLPQQTCGSHFNSVSGSL